MSVIITVIIPTMNRASLLSRALESICHQSYPIENFEIRVVDNDSKDETRAVCKQFIEKLPNLHYHHNPILGLHVSRHIGMKNSKGDIVVFLDDDERAFPTWLEGIAEAFEDPDVALVGGKILPEYAVKPPEWVKELWVIDKLGRRMGEYSLMDLGDRKREIPPGLIWGCNYSIRKRILLDIGGFHPDGMPRDQIRYRGDGESAVNRKIKHRGLLTIYEPKASVHHFVSPERLTKEYLKWRSYIQGISDSYSDIRSSGRIHFKDDLAALAKHLVRMSRNLNRPIKRMALRSYRKGYLFHRLETKRDPQLLKWVLKDNYLED